VTGNDTPSGRSEVSLPEDAAPAGRQSRFWLYAPFVLLALVAAAWTGAWFYIRGRTVQGLDEWIAAEARDGRAWTCADRRIEGYPFRIELTCSTLTVQGNGATGSFGRVEAVAQVYQPLHTIVQVDGPLRLSDGRTTLEAQWRLLEASVRLSRAGLQRASLFAQAPQARIMGLPTDLVLSSESLDLHVRPNPARGADDAADIAASARGARVPPLDALMGGSEPANLQLDLTVTQARGFADGFGPDEVDSWRAAGGQVEILLLSVAKGPRRLEAKGTLRLDDERRPAGQLALSGTGLEELIANLTGNRNGGLFGALLGQAGAKAQSQSIGSPALVPLPPVRLDNGRVALGPFTVPNARLPALY
jgi:hypothetical protein